MKFSIRVLAVCLVITALGIVGYVAVKSSDKVESNPVFADRTLLSGLWNSYKLEYWEDETGRTLDKQQNNITTSEGQSYTLLRSVWQSDKETFDKTLDWTNEQLRREDNLFSWKWGQKADGSYGTLIDQGGQNTASDADSDIALALLMASSRWQQKSYLDQAKQVIRAIWDQEVITINGTPYLASNDLEKDSSEAAIVNPSYLAPYAYRHFATIDKDHDWMKIVDSSYALIDKSLNAPLDTSSSAGLVPDWVRLNRTTGKLEVPKTVSAPNLTTNYSYDAIRTVWRLALDNTWNDEPRAKNVTNKMKFLGEQWNKSNKLIATYSHDGKALTADEPPEAYGTAIGYFMLEDSATAKNVYNTKLKSLYDANNNTWSQKMNYYSDNWTWFGIALYNNQLDDLANKL